MNRPIHIILADSHPSMLRGVNAEFDRDKRFKVLGTTQFLDEIEYKLVISEVDILILDYWFREVNSESVIKRLRQRYPTLKVIIYTQEERLSFIKSVLDNVNGYILKNEPEGTLIKAIERVLQKKKAISEDIREKLDLGSNVHHKLSNQENKILYSRIDGLNTGTISQQLSISENTVRKHLDNARKKLGFTTAEDMMRWFWKQNI